MGLLVITCFIVNIDAESGPVGGMNAKGTKQEQCKSQIYCKGTLLAAVQRANLFADCKYFVDMPGKFDELTILTNFKATGEGRDGLLTFVTENFERPGHELRAVVPGDWKPDPPFIERVKDEGLRKFANIVHGKWKGLVRVVESRRMCTGCASSTIILPHPFVVPGGRFRELYYWDSFWILEGLFVSGMCDTARMTLENYKWLISQYGFIPNGSRLYYLNRSQPPLLVMMVKRYMDRCVRAQEHSEYARMMLPFLDQEYSFWADHRSVMLANPKDSAHPFQLNRYLADTTLPRPEAFLQDSLLAQATTGDAKREAQLFQHLASGAESGWDFSSRWFANGPANFSSIITGDIVPVDLNAIMYRNELILEQLHHLGGDASQRKRYSDRARHRLEGMETYLQSPSGWSDYDLSQGRAMNTDRPFIVSNLAGLWYEAYDESIINSTTIEKLLLSHWHTLWGYSGGIPVDETISGQQWDFPNVWAPVQYHFIKVFETLANRLPEKNAFWREKALNTAQRFINTTYCGYQNYSISLALRLMFLEQFFEKYHAQLVGQPGGGGEYIVQDGFGWTNGVILWLLDQYGGELYAPTECPTIPPAVRSTR